MLAAGPLTCGCKRVCGRRCRLPRMGAQPPNASRSAPRPHRESAGSPLTSVTGSGGVQLLWCDFVWNL